MMVGIRNCALTVSFLLFTTSTIQNPVPLDPRELDQRFGTALEAIFGIGIRLQVLLDDSSVDHSTNFLVSPLSVTLLISQLMLGADQKFRSELYNLLSLPNSNDHRQSIINYYGNRENKTFRVPYGRLHSQMGNLLRALEGNELTKSFTLNCTNGLFVNSDLKLTDQFTHNLQIYKTEIQPVNFSSDPTTTQQIINSWAAEQTRGVIKTILPSVLPASTSAIFANAIYFKADWETPFSYELSMKGPFHAAVNKEVQVEYMQGMLENIPYADSPKLGCKIIKLPYKNDEVAMYFMLPHVNDGKEYNIRKFTENLRTNDVFELLTQLKKSKVALQIPKFKLANSLSLLDPLERYRAFEKLYKDQIKKNEMSKDSVDILDERIDLFNVVNTTEKINIELTEAAENQLLKVSNILQQVSLTVDEKGTEAAAITASIIDYIGGSRSFRLDRPFAFTIRHEITSATLFWGVVVDPTLS